MLAKHVLVGGGTGFIGSRLNKILTQDGYKVTALSRIPGSKRITWHELQRKGIPKGITTVINLSGQNVLDPTRRWTNSFKKLVWDSRIKSTLALVKAIEASKEVKVFVNISGVSHYKPDGKVYSENDPVQEYDFMSKLCIEWEKAATIPRGVDCRSVKIRSGVVIGRGGGMIQSILLPFQLGLGGSLGSGKQPLPWVHIDDLCRLIQYCIENNGASEVVNAVAPEMCTNGQFCKAFAKALHRPSLFSVPEFVIKLLYGKERSALLLTGAKVQPKRALDWGFRFKYPTANLSCAEVVQAQ